MTRPQIVHRKTFMRGPWGSWPLTLVFAEVEGRVECVGIESERPLTATAIRAIPITTYVRRAKREYARDVKAIAMVEPGDFLGGGKVPDRLRRRAAKRVPAAAGPGRPRVPEERFREVAAIYENALRLGRNPTSEVARQKHVSVSTAAKWVARARNEYGFLDRTTRGKATGIPKGRKR